MMAAALWVYLLTFTASVVSSLLFLRFFKKLGLKKTEQTNQVRWSQQAKPTIGGLGMMISFILGAGLLLYSFEMTYALLLSIPLFLAAAVGLIDDLTAVRAIYKLIMQISCGLLLLQFHMGFYTPLPDVVDGFLTVFWTVLIMNSINMLDNMDGISGVVSMVVFTFFSLIFYTGGWAMSASMLSALFAVICLGFLIFNKPSSKMFMGDAGSQFLGVALAWGSMEFISMAGIWNGYISSIWCAFLVLLPSLADTCLVVVNRIRFKSSPFIGGRDHSTHNFAYLGLSGKAVFMLFFALSTFGALLVYKIQTSSTNLFLYISVTYVVAYLMLIFKASSINLKNNKYTYKE